VEVVLGLREGGSSWAKAEKDGFKPVSISEASRRANVIQRHKFNHFHACYATFGVASVLHFITGIPSIVTKNLKGGILYHDGHFDDARLAINIAQTIVENNGVALNYTKAMGFEKTAGKISAVKVQDTETGEEFVVKRTDYCI